jgi:hypothetical protein
MIRDGEAMEKFSEALEGVPHIRTMLRGMLGDKP